MRSERHVPNFHRWRFSCFQRHLEHSEMEDCFGFLSQMFDSHSKDVWRTIFSYLMLKHSIFSFGILTYNCNINVFMTGLHLWIRSTFQHIHIKIQFVSQGNITGNGVGGFALRLDVTCAEFKQQNQNIIGSRCQRETLSKRNLWLQRHFVELMW